MGGVQLSRWQYPATLYGVSLSRVCPPIWVTPNPC
ncbi:hypothetical protein RDI58_021233 [Solanum bulbocastanum]|uniref:Uncharacterized protein n=1 Tax=Solanum bulbocastanum TaxID=147425 RepID=A0AAN8TDN1_SOLBU